MTDYYTLYAESQRQLAKLQREVRRLESQLAAREDAGKLLSVADIAEKFGCCRQTVYRWQDKNLLPPPIVVGGTQRWRAGVIDDWLESNQEQGSNDVV